MYVYIPTNTVFIMFVLFVLCFGRAKVLADINPSCRTSRTNAICEHLLGVQPAGENLSAHLSAVKPSHGYLSAKHHSQGHNRMTQQAEA